MLKLGTWKLVRVFFFAFSCFMNRVWRFGENSLGSLCFRYIFVLNEELKE